MEQDDYIRYLKDRIEKLTFQRDTYKAIALKMADGLTMCDQKLIERYKALINRTEELSEAGLI